MSMLFNHGIAAYRTSLSKDCDTIATNAIALASGSHPNWEICCSREDQFVGHMGFICTGTAMALYERDCDSYIGEGGKRVTNHEELRCDEDAWYESGCITEAFVKNVNVRAFWIKHEVYNEYLHGYQELSAECGLPYRTIKEAEGGREHARRFNQRMYEVIGEANFEDKFNIQMLTEYHRMLDKLFSMGVPVIVITPIKNMIVDDDSPNVKGSCYPHHFRHRIKSHDDLRFIAEVTNEWVDVDKLVANEYCYIHHQ